MFTCQSSDGVQGEKSLPRNQKKETSHKSKQVESSDEQTVMEKIDATKKKMGTLVQRPIEEATLASIVLICGNNYFKMNSLLKAFNSVVNCDSFPNFQRRCIAPVFEEVLSVMNDLVEKLLRNQVEICLCTAGTFNSLNGCISRYWDLTLWNLYLIFSHKYINALPAWTRRVCSKMQNLPELGLIKAKSSGVPVAHSNQKIS